MQESSKWRTDILFYLRQIRANIAAPFRKMNPKAKWDDIQTVFIVSTGRTGTHFLAHFFLNNFDKTYAEHEPEWDPYELNIRYVRGKLSEGQTLIGLDQYRAEQRKMLDREGYEVYIESNHNFAYLLPIVPKYFKNYKILHLVRDGKESVRSYYAKKSGGKRVEEAHILAENDVRRRLMASWFPKDPFHKAWAGWDRFKRVCWYWANKDARMQDAIEGNPNALSMKFEDLFGKNQNEESWNQMIDFLGMRDRMKPGFDVMKYVRETRSNATKKNEIGGWDDWSADQKAAFTEICGPHMERCGYEI